MKLKTYFNAALLCLATSLFAACSSNDFAKDDNKENKQEIPQGVRFTINEPKANAKSRVVINEDGTVAAKTRTFITHTPGMGADAFWSDNDYIWVKNNVGVWKKSIYTAITTPDKKHAMFILPGKLSDYSDGCSVIYNMSQPASSPLANNPEYLNIANLQPQNRANDFSDAGAWGDAGIGKAKLTDAPGEFVFQLAHGVSYLCLLPRCENAALGQNIILKKVKLLGDHYLTATFCNFAADGSVYIPPTSPTGVPSAMYGNIDSDVANFPLTNTTQDITKNGCYFIIVPGTYNFTITYTIKDKVTGIETNIEKKVNGVDCKAGEINDIPAWIDKDLKIQSPPKYYYAMAAQDLYHNHLKADGTYDGVEPQYGDDRYWGSATPNPVFNTIPNRNEACWYAAKGDAHWATITRVMDGHLWHINGIWLKKKAKIMADEGITKEQMESGYPKDNPDDKRDFYIGGAGIGGSVSSAPLLNTSDYFFLPVRYEKIAGGLYSFAPDGEYWAGGIYEGSVTWAHIIFFNSSEIKALSTEPLEFNSVPAYYARQFE